MSLSADTATLLFLDFEASSLSQNSWPIEIGCSRLIKGKTVTRSSLIKPSLNWDLDDWNLAAQKVHGIALKDLEGAPPAIDVARVFYPDLSSCMVFSDQPEFETHWLNRLLGVADLAPVPVQHFSQALEEILSDRQLDFYHERLMRLPAPHRAGPDSARFTEALRYALTM